MHTPTDGLSADKQIPGFEMNYPRSELVAMQISKLPLLSLTSVQMKEVVGS